MTGVVTFALLSLLDVLLLQYCVKIETMYTGERTPEIIKKKKHHEIKHDACKPFSSVLFLHAAPYPLKAFVSTI